MYSLRVCYSTQALGTLEPFIKMYWRVTLYATHSFAILLNILKGWGSREKSINLLYILRNRQTCPLTILMDGDCALMSTMR